MSNILQELESEIASLKTSVSKSNVGIVREIGDGVAKVDDLALFLATLAGGYHAAVQCGSKFWHHVKALSIGVFKPVDLIGNGEYR